MLAFGLSTVFTPLSALADPSAAPVLRGSGGEPLPVTNYAGNTGLRGGIVEEQVVDVVSTETMDRITNTGVDTEIRRGFLPGVAASVAYLGANTMPELLFRGTSDPVSERDVVYTIPEFGALRNSMMHSASAYPGLRTQTATVGDTVASALRGSYITRARLERANVDRARMHAAFANFLPKLNGSVDARNRYIEGTVRTSETKGDAIVGGLEFTLPLYTSGANTNLYKQAQHLSKASDYTYLAEEHRVALEAISAHINLRLNRQVEKTLQGNVAAMQRVAKIARSRFDAGDASRTDIAIADANVESAKAEVVLARRSRKEAQVDYESLTGNSAPGSLDVANISRIVPDTVEQAVEIALLYNPTLNSAEHTAIASKHAAYAERARYGPQVNAYANYNHDLYTTIDDNTTEDWAVGVRLSVPIFDFTAAPNIAAARHESLESGYRALEQGRLVKREVERQWVAYNMARKRTRIVQKQVNALKTSVRGARKEYAAGFRSIIDVLADQVGLARAEIMLERARHERMLAAYQLVFTTADPALRTLPGVQQIAGLH